jgi:hypothetical protein
VGRFDVPFVAFQIVEQRGNLCVCVSEGVGVCVYVGCVCGVCLREGVQFNLLSLKQTELNSF